MPDGVLKNQALPGAEAATIMKARWEREPHDMDSPLRDCLHCRPRLAVE